MGIGETLVVDANLNTTVTPFSTVGIAIADSTLQTDVPPGVANDEANRKGYLITGMRLNEATDGQNTQSVQAGGGTVSSTGATGVGVVTNLWITRTGTNSYATGHSKDGMATRVQWDTRTGIDWTPDSVGFYADVRGTTNVGTMDNLRIVPGNNRLQVNGDLTLTSTGVIELEIGPDAYDEIAVTGVASLAGTFAVDLAGIFDIADGAEYTLLTATGGITTDLGFEFDLPENFSAEIVGSNSLVLTYSAALDGDHNGDGEVDILDYVVWRIGNGPTSDYEDWAANYGSTQNASGSSGNASSGNVPEPATMFLVAVAFGMIAAGTRSRS